MAPILPITLSGENLGQRHFYLNSQVNHAAADAPISFQNIESLNEITAVDRLFKIELAIKLKNVDYILKNLKDDDMLYVSRALKCKWLLERSDIINPKYLENVLFPEMVMPAISRMKHWLYINLNDPLRCQEFYEYYKNIKFDFAVKFLRHCDNKFLLNEFPKILIQITPHYLKVLGEKCSKLVKIYYDSLATNDELTKRYLKNEEAFHNSIKCVLKTDPDLFLDITEKYHLTSFNKLSPSATDYILRCRKSKFLAKVEFYIVYLLDMPTVARRLNVEECQEIVIKLARADYLSAWFSYANVEPLVKRVNRDNRAAFKKRVFVEKDVGEHVAEWPYALPASPALAHPCIDSPHVFDDHEYEPIEKIHHLGFKRMLQKRRGYGCEYAIMSSCPVKSELQKLYDEFRFVGFEGTFHELKRRIGAVSSADVRRDMLLVLVSKSGGLPDNVRTLLKLALHFRNEPVHERASIIRSLVKRANAWRLPQDVWDLMLEYGYGLGLDGSTPEAQCREGLHAVVLRQILTIGECNPTVRTAFINDFSTLIEYKLTSNERSAVAAGLQRILIMVANEVEPEAAARYLDQLLDVLEKYHIRFTAALSPIMALSARDASAVRSLLERLYEARVGRAELLRQYLDFRHDDAALVNALRHDPDALKSELIVKLLTDGETRGNQFFTKLAVYFNETEGIAHQVRRALQDKIADEPDVKLARPLATLASGDVLLSWSEQDTVGGEHLKLAAAFRANMHRARPTPDALSLGWRKAGMKAVAWRAMRCRSSQINALVQELLKERVKRTVRLALVLAPRTNSVVDIFSTASTIRPLAALRAALPYYRISGEAGDLRIWHIVKPYVLNVDLKPRAGLRHILSKVKWIPTDIKPEYCAILYLSFDKTADENADYIRRELMKCLPAVSDNLLEKVLLWVLENIGQEFPKLYPAAVIRYLLLSSSDSELKSRFVKVGEPFLDKVFVFRDGEDRWTQYFFKESFDQIMTSLQYSAVFFDMKYPCCLQVMEKVLHWVQKFLPKDKFFDKYVKIHATMLYFKAVRQSVKQNPDLFQDPMRKMREGVDVVGYTFGRYIVNEVAELKSKYFDSIIELYCNAFIDYLNSYFMFGKSRAKFIVAIIKGMLSGCIGSESRLAVHVLYSFQHDLEDSVMKEIQDLVMKSEDKEIQFFVHAETYD